MLIKVNQPPEKRHERFVRWFIAKESNKKDQTKRKTLFYPLLFCWQRRCADVKHVWVLWTVLVPRWRPIGILLFSAFLCFATGKQSTSSLFVSYWHHALDVCSKYLIQVFKQTFQMKLMMFDLHGLFRFYVIILRP